MSPTKQLDIFKQGRYAQDKIKNSLRSFTSNYIDLDLKEFRLGRKKIDILNKPTECFAILKPDKGNGIVLLNRCDYVTSVKSIFSDSSKFKKLDSDSTLTRLQSLQNYLLQLHKRGAITNGQLDALRPITQHFGRAHDLPKTQKKFDTLPTFRPIIDTTNTPHYNAGKFLTSLLNPLTLNAHSLSDSFDAVTSTNNIPRHLFQEGYQFVSFDVESLFTNVPLKRTVNIILDRIYNDGLFTTTLKKCTLKKLILDCCSKTAFSFDEQIYVQKDGVSMGSSLGPVLANIILTEFERLIVSELIADGTIAFYKRYVDDTLVLIKPSNISAVLAKFNSFDPNLKFIVDTFPEGIVHFLDTKVSVDGTDIYRKDTHTGQYSRFLSFEPFHRKTAWLKSLYHRAFKICSTKAPFKNQIEIIKSFMSWNGYPKSIQNFFYEKTQN